MVDRALTGVERSARVAALIALLVAALAVPAGLQASVIYWAFGDSVTRGEGGGIPLDQDGTDCVPGGYPTKCGYHWRLDDSLTAAGISADVRNRGIAGEETPAGLSRINSVLANICTDPFRDDVVLVMEGTNDVSNSVAYETIAENVGLMIDTATEKCVHGVIASTITRLLAGSALTSHDGDPNHPRTKNLRLRLKNVIAPGRNRSFVDSWLPLCSGDPDCTVAGSCPAQPCYDDKFWGRLALNEPGHVDKQGYNVMAPLFHNAIVADTLPPAPTLTAPSGDIADTTPAFSWPETNRSDWYFLQLQESDGTVLYGHWHPEEGHAVAPTLCSGTCSFDPFDGGIAAPMGSEPALAAGEYRWRVKSRNERGNGSWSAYTYFTVWTAAAGATAGPYTPAAESCELTAGPYTPTFSWGEAADDLEYRLQVIDQSMAVVVDETFDADVVCGGGTCSATPATAIGRGDYTWKVMASNPVGDGPWSAETAFSVYPTDLVVGDLTPEPFHACQTVSTAPAGFSVGGMDVVEFIAGSSIELADGFEVLTGGTFTATLD